MTDPKGKRMTAEGRGSVPHYVVAAIKEWPVKSKVIRHHLANSDICPNCGGPLDTGWECLKCGFDAQYDKEWRP